MITNFKIFENKQIGDLYHLVDINKLNFIIDTNTIKPYKFQNISLTRNKLLNSYLGDVSTTIFKLVIDADKLNHKYKIKSFRYKSNNGIYFDEFEEIVLTQKISNAFDYIKEVVLIKSKVEKLKRNINGDVSDWFTNIGGYGGNLPSLIKQIQDKLKKKYNKGIYIQDKTKIIKDDEYLNSIINYKLKKINTKIIIAYRGHVKASRKYSYKDYLVDTNGNILTDNLVIGDVININNLQETITDFTNMKNKVYDKKFFKQYSEPELDYYNDYGWFKPYIIYIRQLDNKKWKIDDIYPLKTKEKI